MRVRLESIGCRLNIGEMESLARQLAAAGHQVVEPGGAAEVCIFNTCTVTAMASRKSRHILRQLKRTNPRAKIVATGCYAEMEPQALATLGLDLVVGNADKDRLADLLTEHNILEDGAADADAREPSSLAMTSGRTRAFLKVQDGCDNRCTFCVVTLARGAGNSRPASEILQEVHALVEAGYQEAVLSGVHLGSYGHDLGDRKGLQHLVDRILAETALQRLRLSSLEPWDLDDDFFDRFSNPRLLPHLHLPLQSGCDATLRRMARRTSRREFAHLIEIARQRIPNVSISTDVIVGFPGETDDEFHQSIEFVRSMDFSKLHIFRYSPRAGTRAAAMADQVPHSTAAARSRAMHELTAELEAAHARQFVETTASVLWESCEDFGATHRWSGLTEHYLRIVTETPGDVELFNHVTPTTVVATVPGGLLGDVAGISVSSQIEPSATRLPVV